MFKFPWSSDKPKKQPRLKNPPKTKIESMKVAPPKTARPQLSFMWELEVMDRLGYGETVGLYAKTTALPASIVEPIKNYICGSEYTYAGRDVSPRILRVTFFDNELAEAWGFFDYWRLMTNEGLTKRKLLPKFYYRDVIMRMRGSDDQDTLIHIFKDCFPLEVGEMALSYSDSGEATFDVLLAFHSREMKGGRWWRHTFTPTFSGKVIF